MTAPGELVESEPWVFDCDTCEHRQQFDGLDPENADAWSFYARLTAHRWVMDFEGTPWYLAALMHEIDDEARDLLMARVSVIYDTLHPPKS